MADSDTPSTAAVSVTLSPPKKRHSTMLRLSWVTQRQLTNRRVEGEQILIGGRNILGRVFKCNKHHVTIATAFACGAAPGLIDKNLTHGPSRNRFEVSHRC